MGCGCVAWCVVRISLHCSRMAGVVVVRRDARGVSREHAVVRKRGVFWNGPVVK